MTPAIVDSVVTTIEAATYSTTNLIWASTNTDVFVIAPFGDSQLETLDRDTGEKDFDLVIEQKEELRFYWKFTYRDIFNQVRHTDFGFRISGAASNLNNGAFILPYGKLNMD